MRFVRFVGVATLGLVTLGVTVLVGFLGYRGYRQHENAAAMVIRTPHGIDEARYALTLPDTLLQEMLARAVRQAGADPSSGGRSR